MDSQDLLSVHDDEGQQWAPLQPTSTPKEFGADPHFSDPLLQQHMNPLLMDPQFDPCMPMPSLMVDPLLQPHMNPLLMDPQFDPCMVMPSSVIGVQPGHSEQWLYLRQAEQDKQQHELRLMEMKLQAEREQRQFELERLRLQQEQSREHIVHREGQYFKDIKIKPLEDSDDVDIYLSAFERLAEANKWPRPQWATRLAAALTGKAREAFTRLSMQDSGDYTKLKEAVLRAYNLTPEAYRLKFRSAKRLTDETHMQFAVRLRTLFDRWTSGENVTNIAELQDLLIREQMLENYYFHLQVYLKDRRPANVVDLAELAEHYELVHSRDHRSFKKPNNRDDQPSVRTDAKKTDKKQCVSAERRHQGQRCWKCSGYGHVQRDCKKVLLANGACDLRKSCGSVNGQPVNILMDNGCQVTLVHSDFVKLSDFVGRTITVCVADGRYVAFPLADVDFHSSLYEGILRVGVVDNLPEDVLLAVEAIPTSVRFLDDARDETNVCVVTRSQQKTRELAEESDVRARGKVKLSSVVTPNKQDRKSVV